MSLLIEDDDMLGHTTVPMINCNNVTWGNAENRQLAGLFSSEKNLTYRLALCPESGSIIIKGQLGTRILIESTKPSSDNEALKVMK